MSDATVRVLLFATLRQTAGAAELVLPLSDGESVAGCWDSLCHRHPALTSSRDAVRPALNRVYVSWEATVAPGDELAFIPPVSGGGAP